MSYSTGTHTHTYPTTSPACPIHRRLPSSLDPSRFTRTRRASQPNTHVTDPPPPQRFPYPSASPPPKPHHQPSSLSPAPSSPTPQGLLEAKLQRANE